MAGKTAPMSPGVKSSEVPPCPTYDHEIAMTRRLSPGRDLAALGMWIRLMRRLRPTGVVAGTPKASLLALTAARLVGVPARLYIIHGAVWDGATGSKGVILRTAESVTLRSSTDALAVSRSLSGLVAREIAGQPRPTVLGLGSVVGVDTEVFHPSTEKHDPPVLCFVGRLHRSKNIDSLLEVFDAVRVSYPVRLRIVGALDYSAPPSPQTMQRISGDPEIEWLGARSDVAQLLQDSSLFVFPTSREGLPQVVLEASSVGIPTVGWAATGVVDSVEDGVTGLLSPVGDVDGMAQNVLQLLRNPYRLATMGEAARRHAVSHFDWEVVAPRTAKYIDTLVRGRGMVS